MFLQFQSLNFYNLVLVETDPLHNAHAYCLSFAETNTDSPQSEMLFGHLRYFFSCSVTIFHLAFIFLN